MKNTYGRVMYIHAQKYIIILPGLGNKKISKIVATFII